MDPKEIRMTDAKTGAQKGAKLARFDLIPVQPLTELAEHFGRGARKYQDRNFERGYKWSLSYAALQRHLNLFWNGEEFDNCHPDCPPDCVDHTGSHHLAAAMWHCVALREFTLYYPEGDDRAHVARAARAAAKENK
jgi:hypothetical protein